MKKRRPAGYERRQDHVGKKRRVAGSLQPSEGNPIPIRVLAQRPISRVDQAHTIEAGAPSTGVCAFQNVPAPPGVVMVAHRGSRTTHQAKSRNVFYGAVSRSMRSTSSRGMWIAPANLSALSTPRSTIS